MYSLQFSLEKNYFPVESLDLLHLKFENALFHFIHSKRENKTSQY